MINANWEQLLGEFANLAGAYRALPDHIAKKHLLAAMRKSLKDVKGVELLRQNTPPTSTRRGRKRKGEKRSTGELRRSVTTKAKWIGRNRDGAAFAALGYKYNRLHRKAIWQEFGTTRMAGRHMMERVFQQIRGPAAARLAGNLRDALERATAEVAGGRNKGYGG